MSDSFVFLPKSERRSAPKRRKVAVTGANGRIGRYFAQKSSELYDLRLLVHDHGDDLAKHPLAPYGEIVATDIDDVDRLVSDLQDIDTVLHLAADPNPVSKWKNVLETNIVGTYNVFHAAEAVGVRKIVYASSIHAVSGYPRGRQVHADDPPNPGDLYGVTKVFGEGLARFMSSQRGVRAICVRIGAFQPLSTAEDPEQLELLHAFVSRRDLVQLLQKCVDDEALQFAIVHGLSNNAYTAMDITETMELLGYQPQDDFAAINPLTKDLDLRRTVVPHDEEAAD